LTALASVALSAACTGGVSFIGSGDEPLGKSGGVGASSAGGSRVSTPGSGGTGADASGAGGVGASSMAGETARPAGAGGVSVAGADAGMGGDAATEPCQSDSGCPDLGLPCQACSDGSYACEKNHCDSGVCVRSADTCPAECQTERDCPTVGLACTDCGDGTRSCPSMQCLKGKCKVTFPGCNDVNPCDSVVCGTQCKQCTGSNCTPGVLVYCGADGLCEPGIPQCESDVKCRNARDCGEGPPNCVFCGTDACAAYECIDGACVFKCPLNPNPQCKDATDCPLANRVCKPCLSGGCEAEACLNGVCQRVCPL
jgi:hypothetical protein